MKSVKKTSEYTISQRRDGRYSVKDKRNNPVNGEEKVKILLAEELIKLSAASPAEKAEPEVEAPVAEEADVTEAEATEATGDDK